MASVPLNHLLKIGSDGLQTTAQTLSAAVNELNTNKANTSAAHLTSDSASTDIADDDYFPFYDTSATSKKKTLWSNIKSVLKTYFDGIYSTIKTLAGLTDTTISNPSNGQVLTYDGSKWINGNISVSGKADKVSGATNGNLAGLDSNGNLTDSGHDVSDFARAIQVITSSPVVRWDGTFTFTGIDTTIEFFLYDVYVSVDTDSVNKNPSVKLVSVTGRGTTNTTFVYETDADPFAIGLLKVTDMRTP